MQDGSVDTGTMTPAAFVTFAQEVLTQNEQFAGMLGAEEAAQLGTLATLTDVAQVTAPLTADQMALALGMDAATVDQVYRYYLLVTTDMSWYVLTVQQVLANVVDDIAVNPLYADSFDEATLAQLSMLRTVAEHAAWAVELAPEQVSAMLGLDTGLVQFVYEYAGTIWGTGTPATTTIDTFLNVLLDGVIYNAEVLSWLGPETGAALTAQAPQLEQVRGISNMAAQWVALNADTMAATLGMDAALMYQAYLTSMLADGSAVLPSLSVQQFLSFVIDSLAPNPQFAGMVDEASLASLYQARAIVDATMAGTEYDALGLSQLFGIDYAQVSQLMAYRAYMLQGGIDWTLDLATLVPFLVSTAAPAADQQSGEPAEQDGAAQAMSQEELDELELLATVMADAQAGKVYTAAEMAALLGEVAPELDANDIQLLYLLDAALSAPQTAAKMTLEEFVDYAATQVVDDPLFASVIDEEQAQELTDSQEMLADAKDQLVGKEFARAVLEAAYPRESQEMQDLIYDIMDVMDSTGTDYYLVGDAAMATEMRASFSDEFDFITLLTAGIIYAIVLLTFRSLFVPLVLVALIQTAINLTMGITVLQGIDTYYVALMVVQALLMGATIDYAILFTTSYREMREAYDPRESIARAFQTSIGTIMTSSSILVLVTFAVGMTSADVTIAEVCLTISKGSLVAVTLVVLMLPGMLAALDPLVAGPKRLRKDPTHDHTPPAPPTPPHAGPARAHADAPQSPVSKDDFKQNLDVLASVGVPVAETNGWHLAADAAQAAPQSARSPIQPAAATQRAFEPAPAAAMELDEPEACGRAGDIGQPDVDAHAQAPAERAVAPQAAPAYRPTHFAPRRNGAADDFAAMDAFLAQGTAAHAAPPVVREAPATQAQPPASQAASGAASSSALDDAMWAELLKLAVPKPADGANTEPK